MAGKIKDKHIDSLLKAIVNNISESDFDRILQLAFGRKLPANSLPYELNVLNVLKSANEQNWSLHLLDVLVMTNLDHRELLQIGAFYFDHFRKQNNLQKKVTNTPIHKNHEFDVQSFLISQRICRVEVIHNMKTSGGTGFLIGPDLVMTNYHVVDLFIEGKIGFRDVTFRFDFWESTGSSGTPVKPKSNDSVIIASNISDKDLEKAPTPLSESWGTDDLDFAIVQLEREIGREPACNVFGSQDQIPARGWINVPQLPIRASNNEGLIIYQHPLAQALSRGFGRTLRNEGPYNKSLTRFRYEVNTEQGSSGSPCFNHNWELIGVHHSGSPEKSPTYNQGICMNAIRRFLTSNNVVLIDHAEILDLNSTKVVLMMEGMVNVVSNSSTLDDLKVAVEDILGDQLSVLVIQDHQESRYILNNILRIGKLPYLISQIKVRYPTNDDLNNIVDQFSSQNLDPFESEMLHANRPFLNRTRLREVSRKFLSGTVSPIVLVDGDRYTGKSLTTQYMYYLRDHTDIIDQVVKIDLQDFLIDEELINEQNIAKLIDKELGLVYKQWSHPFKISPFVNHLLFEMRKWKKRRVIVFDGFQQVGTLEKKVCEFINYLARRVINDGILRTTVLLIGFRNYVTSEIVNEATVDQTSKFDLDDVIDYFEKVYQRRKILDPSFDYNDDHVEQSIVDLQNRVDISNGNMQILIQELRNSSQEILKFAQTNE